jgi:hypothetical protein
VLFRSPGDKITLQAQVEPDCYFKSFVVNGKTIAAKSYSYIATDAVSYKAQVVAGVYVQELMLDKTDLSLGTKKTAQLKTEIWPSYATSKKIVWKSSNPKVATVSASGVVKAVSQKVGATATITAKAADRGTIIATCKVKVTATVLKKNEKVTVAGITYKVTKSDKKNGKVSLVGVKNKKAKKITIPAAIKVNGVSYKVTALEKTALKGLSKLRSITIKSANLSKLSKGSLSSVNKKVVIKVPAKSKTAFKKLIKNAGFKGTVK